jgi:2-iminobutanoate/2-iminopropanoate deaminase
MQIFNAPEAEGLRLPFSSAVRVGDLLFLSGAIGNLPGSLTLAEGGTPGETRQTMDNIGATLKHCGLGFADVVKVTVMLADMSEWAAFNAVYIEYFARERLPARSAFGCNGLALGARLEIECVAHFPPMR